MVKVLIADDNNVMRKILRTNVSKISKNFLVTEAKDGKETIKALLNDEYQLLFLDLNMPFFSGFDISNYIKSKKYDIEIVVISSELNNENKEIFTKLGVTNFVEKPFNIYNFESVVLPITNKLQGKN